MAWAAKEALFKALGTGKVGRMAWHDVVLAWPEGAAQPTMAIAGETAAVARQLEVTGVHCAVTATREHGVAWVVVTGARVGGTEARSQKREEDSPVHRVFFWPSDNSSGKVPFWLLASDPLTMRGGRQMSFDYDQLRRDISWARAERELGYREGDPVNIGYLCVDRHVEAGRGDALALIHESHEGELRQFTFLDLQQLTNGWAHFLRGNACILPARPGVPVPRQGAGALHRVPGHPEDRGRRRAALLGLRRRRARGAHARQPGRGHHHRSAATWARCARPASGCPISRRSSSSTTTRTGRSCARARSASA